MTINEAIAKLIATAEAEVGYLEKASNAQLDSKTANAGSNNYTKYWRDTYPQYQGQAWCACFVTWCLAQAFGKNIASAMLHHFPYVYCPSGRSAAKTYGEWGSTPKIGSVIIFQNSSGVASHTGFVYAFDNNCVYTIEGNTSGASGVVPNGGGVCKKSYSKNYGRIAGYWNIDYSLAANKEDATATEKKNEEELMSKEYIELKEKMEAQQKQIDALRVQNGYYNYIDSNMNEYYKPTIQKLVGKGILQGNDKGELMLTTDMMRILTVLDRQGVFD